eukprot:SAG31_NODE_4987_length_2819_cov_1.180147_4_plen_65_part_00
MLRKVANGIIAFRLKIVKEILSIYDEFVMGLSKEHHGYSQVKFSMFINKDPDDFLVVISYLNLV